MKLKLRMISLTLVLLLALLILGGSAGAESAEMNISGTLRVSSLPDGAAIQLIEDTTLILDAPKRITSIRGDYRLSLRGSQTLTVENPVGTAIQVDSLLIRGSVTAIGEYGLRANGDIDISEGSVRVEARADGICSDNGAVRLDGSVEIAAGDYGVYAVGDVTLAGAVRAEAAVGACSESGTLCASGDIHALGGDYGLYGYAGVSITGGTVEAAGTRHDAIRAQAGAVTLDGTVSARGGENGVFAQLDVTQTGSVSAEGGSGDGIRAQEGSIRLSGEAVAEGGGFGLCAKQDISAEDGSIDAAGAKNDGIRAQAGAIDLKADVRARGVNHGVFAHGDVCITGQTDATGLQGSGICTDASASVSGELLICGREYGVYARGDASLAGSGSVTGTVNDGVRAHTGQVTLSGELTCTGRYGVFGGSGVTMTGGALTAGGSSASAIVSEFGAVCLDGSIRASGAEYGIYAYTDLSLNGTVEAEGAQHDGIRAHTGTVAVAADVTARGPLHCIFGGGGVRILSGRVVTGEGSNAGVYSEYGPVFISGELEASGSEYGVYAYTDVTVENARVKASSDQHDGIRAQTGSVSIAGNVEATGELYGIYAHSGMSLLRGSLTAIGKQYDGIYAILGPVSLAGSVVAEGGYYGIYADGDVNVSLGTVSATGRKDAGIVAGYGSMIISGHVTASGGDYGVFCDQVFRLLDGGTLTASGGLYDGVHVRSGSAELSGEMSIHGGYYGVIANEIEILGGTLDVSGGNSSFFSRNCSITIGPSLQLSQPEGAAVGSVTILGSDCQDATRVVITDPGAPANPFADVDKENYYYDPVHWAVTNEPQVTTGTSDTTFSPDATCTRAQAVTFLWRARGCPEPAINECRFEDVAQDAYYYKAVLWAVEKGITIGTSDTTFSPDLGCTRAHVVTFLHREQDNPAPESEFNPFGDVAGDVYYYLPVLWAVERGITVGTSDTTFSPHSTCTRAQIVTFLYRDTVYAAR